MKKRKLLLTLLGLVGLIVLALYFVWPRDHLDVQLRQSERSADGNWEAVVQLEVFNTAWVVNDAVYAVRLKGRMQRDNAGGSDYKRSGELSHTQAHRRLARRHACNYTC